MLDFAETLLPQVQESDAQVDDATRRLHLRAIDVRRRCRRPSLCKLVMQKVKDDDDKVGNVRKVYNTLHEIRPMVRQAQYKIMSVHRFVHSKNTVRRACGAGRCRSRRRRFCSSGKR